MGGAGPGLRVGHGNGNGMKQIRISFCLLAFALFGYFFFGGFLFFVFSPYTPVLCTFCCLLCETSQLNKNKSNNKSRAKRTEKRKKRIYLAKDEKAPEEMCFLLFFRFGSALTLSHSPLSGLFSDSRRHKEPKIKYFRLLHIAASGRANRFCFCYCCSIPVHSAASCCCCLLECICTDGRQGGRTHI